MHIAADTDVSLLDPYRTEWASLRARRHNVLIEGPVAATHTVLRLLQPHIGKPILWKLPHARLELPSREAGALILEDVATLTAEDQTQLLTRLNGGFQTQVVSTSEQPLFVLVERRLFDAALYYRLNVVLLRAQIAPTGGIASPFRPLHEWRNLMPHDHDTQDAVVAQHTPEVPG